MICVVLMSQRSSGKHVVHAYTAGNEPYSIWEGLDRKSEEYKELKKQRAECLYKALERLRNRLRLSPVAAMVAVRLQSLSHESRRDVRANRICT